MTTHWCGRLLGQRCHRTTSISWRAVAVADAAQGAVFTLPLALAQHDSGRLSEIGEQSVTGAAHRFDCGQPKPACQWVNNSIRSNTSKLLLAIGRLPNESIRESSEPVYEDHNRLPHRPRVGNSVTNGVGELRDRGQAAGPTSRFCSIFKLTSGRSTGCGGIWLRCCRYSGSG